MVSLKRIFVVSLLLGGVALSMHAMECIYTAKREVCGVHVLVKQLRARFVGARAMQPGLRRTNDGSCGLYATHNVFCFMRSLSDRYEGLFLDDNGFAEAKTLCLEVNGSIDFSRTDSGNMVRNLLKKLEKTYNVSADMRRDVTVIDDIGESQLKALDLECVSYSASTTSGSAELLGCGNRVILFSEPNTTKVPKKLVTDDFFMQLLSPTTVELEMELENRSNELSNSASQQEVVRIEEVLHVKGRRLLDGHAQCFVVCSHKHWLAFRVEWVAGGLVILIADSSGKDVTSINMIDRIVKFMKLTESE